jgi:hypothetical protein
MINQINNKICATFLCIAFSFVSLSAQIEEADQIQTLLSEIENLKSINGELRREFDSLLGLKNSKLPNGYYVRLNGGFLGNDGVTYQIRRDQVDGKQVYSITSFSNAHEAYMMATALRQLNLKEVEVVKIDAETDPVPPPSQKKISRTMEIID